MDLGASGFWNIQEKFLVKMVIWQPKIDRQVPERLFKSRNPDEIELETGSSSKAMNLELIPWRIRVLRLHKTWFQFTVTIELFSDGSDRSDIPFVEVSWASELSNYFPVDILFNLPPSSELPAEMGFPYLYCGIFDFLVEFSGYWDAGAKFWAKSGLTSNFVPSKSWCFSKILISFKITLF